MAKYWDYETELPGDMSHTLQVQPTNDEVDSISTSMGGQEGLVCHHDPRGNWSGQRPLA